METILKFDLSGDDNHDFQLAIIAPKLASIIWDLDQWLRNECKYKDLDDSTDAAYEAVRDKIRELFDDHSISIDAIL